MAASSGAFGDEIIGKPQPSGRASVAEADEEEEEEEEAPSGGAKAALLGLAKKHLAGDESFTLSGAPVERGINWFAVIFFVMCILVLFFTSR